MTVVLPTPANVVPEATSARAVQVQWSYSGIADTFDVYRNGQFIGYTATSPFVDTAAPSGTAFVYHVTARKVTSVSPPSAADLATTAIYTRTVAAGSAIMAGDMLEIRHAVNAVRTAAGLAAFPFTDPSLGGVAAKAVHVSEPANGTGSRACGPAPAGRRLRERAEKR